MATVHFSSLLFLILASATFTLATSAASSGGFRAPPGMVPSTAPNVTPNAVPDGTVTGATRLKAIERVAGDVDLLEMGPKFAPRLKAFAKIYNALFETAKPLLQRLQGGEETLVIHDFPGNPVRKDPNTYVVAVTVSIDGEPMIIYFQYVGGKLCYFIRHGSHVFLRFADHDHELFMYHLMEILYHRDFGKLNKLLPTLMTEKDGEVAMEAMELAVQGAAHRDATVLYHPLIRNVSEGIVIKGRGWKVEITIDHGKLKFYTYSDKNGNEPTHVRRVDLVR